MSICVNFFALMSWLGQDKVHSIRGHRVSGTDMEYIIWDSHLHISIAWLDVLDDTIPHIQNFNHQLHALFKHLMTFMPSHIYLDCHILC